MIPRAALRLLLLLFAILLLGSCHDSPTEPLLPAPSTPRLTGEWLGYLPDRTGIEGWEQVRLILLQEGENITGEAATATGARHRVSGNAASDRIDLVVYEIPSDCRCASYGFESKEFLYDDLGVLRSFSGMFTGRCCGTISHPFTFTRQ